MSQNKCPYCDKVLTQIRTKDVTLTIGIAQPAWKGFSHACPYCNRILSIEVNPLTIQGEIIDEVKKTRR